MDQLEKIDILRARTGMGYGEAVRLLEETGGDVVEALVRHEEKTGRAEGKADLWSAEGLVQRLKELIKTGNVTHLRVKRDGRTLVDLPVTAGVVGAVIAPSLALVAGVACLVSRCSIEIEHEDGQVDVHDFHASGYETPN